MACRLSKAPSLGGGWWWMMNNQKSADQSSHRQFAQKKFGRLEMKGVMAVFNTPRGQRSSNSVHRSFDHLPHFPTCQHDLLYYCTWLKTRVSEMLRTFFWRTWIDIQQTMSWRNMVAKTLYTGPSLVFGYLRQQFSVSEASAIHVLKCAAEDMFGQCQTELKKALWRHVPPFVRTSYDNIIIYICIMFNFKFDIMWHEWRCSLIVWSYSIYVIQLYIEDKASFPLPATLDFSWLFHFFQCFSPEICLRTAILCLQQPFD